MSDPEIMILSWYVNYIQVFSETDVSEQEALKISRHLLNKFGHPDNFAAAFFQRVQANNIFLPQATWQDIAPIVNELLDTSTFDC